MNLASAIIERPFWTKLRDFLLAKSTWTVKGSLFLLFLITIGVRFINIPYDDSVSFSKTVEAINEGYRFHEMEHNSGYLGYTPYYKILGDHGFRFVLSGISKVFSYIPSLSNYEFTTNEIPIISFFILVILNIALLTFPLSNLLIISSQFAFLFSIHLIDETLIYGYSNYRALDGIVPLLVAQFIALILFSSEKKYPFILLGLLGGALSLFRQSIPLTFQLSLLGVFLSSCLFFKNKKNWKETFPFKVLKKIGLVFASFLFVNCMISLLCTMAFDCPFSLTPPLKHGSGQPLYCSLGYVENAYNIAWEDDNAFVNHILTFGTPEILPHEWAENLGELYWKFVKEDPTLFFRNILAKSLKLNEYLLHSEILLDNSMDITSVTPYKIHLVCYLIFAFFLVFLVFRKQYFLFLSTLALAITSASVPILIFPGYYASFLGFLFSAVFILFPLVTLKTELLDPRQEIKRILISFSVVAVIISSILLYQKVSEKGKLLELVSDENPKERIEMMGYEYGYLFNRLSKEEQEVVLSKLNPEASKTDSFSTQFLYLQEMKDQDLSQAHLIVYLPDTWTPPLPRADQGPVGSYILLSKGNRNFINVGFEYIPHSCVYNRLADAAWNGKYTFLTLPISPKLIEDRDELSVSAWELVYDETALGKIGHKEIASSEL